MTAKYHKERLVVKTADGIKGIHVTSALAAKKKELYDLALRNTYKTFTFTPEVWSKLNVGKAPGKLDMTGEELARLLKLHTK